MHVFAILSGLNISYLLVFIAFNSLVDEFDSQNLPQILDNRYPLNLCNLI